MPDLLEASVARATAVPATLLDPSWWAGGLTLAERCEPAGRPTVAASSTAATRAERRLDRWRAAYWSGGLDALTSLLGATGLDEAGLLALLAEEPAELAGRTEQPGWARATESVLAAMPAEPHLPDRPADDDVAGWRGLATIVAPFVASAIDQFTAAAPGPSAGEVTGLAATLERSLVLLAARTLVLELHVLRASDRLSGDTPQQRYRSFVRHFAAPAGLARLLTEYPVLARLLVETSDRAVAGWARLRRRLDADRAAIVENLLGGNDPGPLVDVGPAGDGWCDPLRSSMVLSFSDGSRLVYRPHQLGSYAFVRELVTWLDRRVPDLDLRTVDTLDRSDYGWVEFVEARACADDDERQRLHYRWGALLALLHVSGASDLRDGDVVGCGDQPVPVDLAQLFQTPPSTGDTDPATVAMLDAVRLAAPGPPRSPLRPTGYPGMQWHAPGTDQMRLARQATAPAAPSFWRGDAESALLAGFDVAYAALVAGRSELIESEGLVWRFGDAETQLSVQRREGYQQALADTTHPDVLRDALDRDQLLGIMLMMSAGTPARDNLARGELTALRAGVTPRFAVRADSPDVMGLDRSPLDHVADRIRAMGPRDRAAQEWMIRARLAERAVRVSRAPGSHDVDPQWTLDVARGLADQIARAAYDQHGRAGWVGLATLDDRRWVVRPLDLGLDGYPGVALFFAKLAELTGEERYAAVARRALAHVPALLDRLDGVAGGAGAVPSGAFHGVSGLAYALVQVAASLGDGPLPGATLSSIASMAMTGISLDPTVTTGTAGCVAAMLSIDSALDSPVARRVAQVGVRRLTGAEGEPVTVPSGLSSPVGFARGPSGTGWALLRHAAATGQERSAELGRAALREEGRPERLGWCDGLAGIGLARAGLRYLGDPNVDADLDAALAAVVSAGPLADDSLCHGELGCLELLSVAIEHGRTDLAGARGRRATGLLDRLEHDGARCGTPRAVPTPGLLTGLAGIGYGVLRLGFPDRVPSVLLLDPPRSRP